MPSPVIDLKASPDFEAMTIDELTAESFRLASVLDLVESQRVAIFAMICARKARASAEQRIDKMTDIDKDALMQVLKP